MRSNSRRGMKKRIRFSKLKAAEWKIKKRIRDTKSRRKKYILGFTYIKSARV
jgi:hypothetical protein